MQTDKAFENINGKQENTLNQHFPHFPPTTRFSTFTQREAVINPLPDDKILDWSKLKQIADKFQSVFQMKN